MAKKTTETMAVMGEGSDQGNYNDFLNSLLQNGTTTDLYQTYYNELAAGGTTDQADAAVQAYINKAGYSQVTTSQVDSAILNVAGGSYSQVSAGKSSNVTYPPFGTTPTIMYGTYQTFDSKGNPSILIMIYANGSTWQLKVATASTGQLIDITSSAAFQGTSGEFIILSSTPFPYNGTLKFSSCVVDYKGTSTTDFDVVVSLTPSGPGNAITSSGRRSVYSSTAALQPATVDAPSIWTGSYSCQLNSSTQATLSVSSDGSSITFQGTAASSTVFNPFSSSFACVLGNNTLLIYMQWTYF
ncbi:MAG: hypothetical protein K8F30_07495, partial [Taibaiella sp.]|nr:hypothetical protein [Taibaiella sp.]